MSDGGPVSNHHSAARAIRNELRLYRDHVPSSCKLKSEPLIERMRVRAAKVRRDNDAVGSAPSRKLRSARDQRLSDPAVTLGPVHDESREERDRRVISHEPQNVHGGRPNNSSIGHSRREDRHVAPTPQLT